MFNFLKKFFGSSQERTLHRFRQLVVEVNAWEEKFQKITDDEARQKTVVLLYLF